MFGGLGPRFCRKVREGGGGGGGGNISFFFKQNTFFYPRQSLFLPRLEDGKQSLGWTVKQTFATPRRARGPRPRPAPVDNSDNPF